MNPWAIGGRAALAVDIVILAWRAALALTPGAYDPLGRLPKGAAFSPVVLVLIAALLRLDRCAWRTIGMPGTSANLLALAGGIALRLPAAAGLALCMAAGVIQIPFVAICRRCCRGSDCWRQRCC